MKNWNSTIFHFSFFIFHFSFFIFHLKSLPQTDKPDFVPIPCGTSLYHLSSPVLAAQDPSAYPPQHSYENKTSSFAGQARLRYT